MTVSQMMKSAVTLSNGEKFELVEALLQMLRASFQSTQMEWEEASAQDAVKERASVLDVDIKEYYLAHGRQKMAALAAELSSRPNPPREKMLPRGLFAGITINDDDFRMAEYHPTDEELMGE